MIERHPIASYAHGCYVTSMSKNAGEKDVHGCSNIADLNTGVSLQSSPILKESAQYFVGDFAICSKRYLDNLPPQTIHPRELAPDLQTTSPLFFYPLPSQTSC